MFVGVFDLFKIGLGPSSSHTVGPMKAAREALRDWSDENLLDQIARVEVTLYGSLALTGLGHGTDQAVLLGLMGEVPDAFDPERLQPLMDEIRLAGSINLLGRKRIPWNSKTDLIWRRNQNLPHHPNGLLFTAFGPGGDVIGDRSFYSVGGGFIVSDRTLASPPPPEPVVPFPFKTAEDLLQWGISHSLKIPQIVLANELALRSEKELREGIFARWEAMKSCMERGYRGQGVLPGGLKVRRRAPTLWKELQKRSASPADPLAALDWLNLDAIAVNEENACHGRVVTAPTNGAAGIIPSVLRYYERFVPQANENGVVDFFLTATAIGTLYKLNASISGAEVGCQGEVGVASSMAAGALAAVMGGTNEQIENAAEIAMEHHLGMTCDPVGGLVQIPCIERNAMGAVKALNAARLALQGDGQHTISLDRVIKTMWETGQDMSTKYKETSRGGLAVNITEC